MPSHACGRAWHLCPSIAGETQLSGLEKEKRARHKNLGSSPPQIRSLLSSGRSFGLKKHFRYGVKWACWGGQPVAKQVGTQFRLGHSALKCGEDAKKSKM